jgi:outer membrane scaffolding protein for murein synthesis (MipA/OmpV family)
VKRLILVAAAATFAAPAHAQDAPPVPLVGGPQADSVTIGIGAGYLPDYEGSDDYRFSPVPGAIGSIGGFGFVVAGNRASVDLIPNQAGPGWDLQAGPIGLVNFNRTSINAIDDARVKALGKLGTAIELGGYVGIARRGVITSDYDQLTLSVSYRKDVAGVHEAGILQPTISYATPLSTKAAVGLIVSAERAERGYGRAYFDVAPGQVATSGLPVFTTRGGWKNWQVGAVGTYALTGDLLKGWKLVGGVNYRRMLNDFGDSPIVSIAGSRSQWLGALGVGYTF